MWFGRALGALGALGGVVDAVFGVVIRCILRLPPALQARTTAACGSGTGTPATPFSSRRPSRSPARSTVNQVGLLAYRALGAAAVAPAGAVLLAVLWFAANVLNQRLIDFAASTLGYSKIALKFSRSKLTEFRLFFCTFN